MNEPASSQPAHRAAGNVLHSETTLEGDPLWLVSMDRRGRADGGTDGAARVLANLIGQRGTTDVFLMAHGWNNSRTAATSLYHRFFNECSHLLSLYGIPTDRKVGYAGVFWPSVHWPDADVPAPHDDSLSHAGEGGAARLAGAPAGSSIADATMALFTEAGERAEAEMLLSLLHQQEDSEAALEEFMGGLRRLALDELGDAEASSAAQLPDEDALEGDALFTEDWRLLLDMLADHEPPPGMSPVPGDSSTAEALDAGGAASAGRLGRLWRGARGALRLLGYWTMKRRAGIVGQDGLGPLITEVAEHAPGVRFHLVGHSFGARLVSYALKGLSSRAQKEWSPVKSLLLLQGAFSHYSFASVLPHDLRRAGHLKGMSSRVDGPLMATHSRHDTAVRYAYPLASLVARQDASAMRDPASRWGAMGDGGAQAVNATRLQLHPVGNRYDFEGGAWYNLNGDDVIRHGPAPSGAHGDVVHPETAWAAVQAAGLGTA